MIKSVKPKKNNSTFQPERKLVNMTLTQCFSREDESNDKRDSTAKDTDIISPKRQKVTPEKHDDDESASGTEHQSSADEATTMSTKLDFDKMYSDDGEDVFSEDEESVPPKWRPPIEVFSKIVKKREPITYGKGKCMVDIIAPDVRRAWGFKEYDMERTIPQWQCNDQEECKTVIPMPR